MGTKPGKRMMGQLERRAEAISGEFNSQDHTVANTLWRSHGCKHDVGGCDNGNEAWAGGADDGAAGAAG